MWNDKWIKQIPMAFIPYAIGILLLVAAVLKAYELSTGPVIAQEFLSSRSFLIGLVLFELAFGFILLSGLWSRQIWKATIALFALFAAFSLYKALAGFESCGCFGRMAVNPWWTFTSDLILLAFLSRCKPHSEDIAPTVIPKLQMVAMLFFSTGLPLGYFMASYAPTVMNQNGVTVDNGRLVVLEPEKWIGQLLPIGSSIDVFKQLNQNHSILLLYHYDCPKCQEVLPQYERLAAEQTPENATIAMIEVPPYGELHHKADQKILHGKLSDKRDWFVRTPVEIRLENGIVTQVSDDSELFSSSTVLTQ